MDPPGARLCGHAAASAGVHPPGPLFPGSNGRIPALLSLLLFAIVAGAPGDPAVVVTGYQYAPFISPMGEPFRSRGGSTDTLQLWFAAADADRDGSISKTELVADAERFFARLDGDTNGRVEPEEMIDYEWTIAPDVQLGRGQKREPGTPAPKPAKREDRSLARHLDEGRLQGAARYALLNIPQPVAAADLNFDRVVTLAEFRAAAAYRFDLLDSSRKGSLNFAALDTLRRAMLAEARKKAKRRHRGDEDEDSRVATPL